MKKEGIQTKILPDGKVQYKDNPPISLPFTFEAPMNNLAFYADLYDPKTLKPVFQRRDDGSLIFNDSGRRMQVEEFIAFERTSKSNASYKNAHSTYTVDGDTEIHILDAILKRYYDKTSCVTDENGMQKLREPERHAEKMRQMKGREQDQARISELEEQLKKQKEIVKSLEKKSEKK